MKENMNTLEKIEYIYDNIPEAMHDSKLLILIYWQLFDHVVLPDDVLGQLVNVATNPETITRTAREVKGKGKEITKDLVKEKLKKLESKLKEEE